MASSSLQKKRTKGFTLIELMIVVAIIGILASIALPQYETYAKRSRFTEVVMATTPYKQAFEVAVHTGKITALANADSGTNGIPAATGASGVVASVSMTDGVILGQGSAAVDNHTVTYTANGTTPPIQWAQGGSCVAAFIC